MPYGYVPNYERAMRAYYAQNAPQMRVNPASIPGSARVGVPYNISAADTETLLKSGVGLGAGASGSSAAKAAAGAADDVAKAAKSKRSFVKKGGMFDSKSGKMSGFMDKVGNPEFDYDPKTGVQGWGKNLGTLWNVGQLALQGYGVAQDLQSAGQSSDRSEDLLSKIAASSYGSPTLMYDLSPEQMDAVRKIRDGSYDLNNDLGDIDLLSLLGDVGMGVLGGIPGGVTGMVLGGLGGLGSGLANDYSNAQAREASELEALYQAVLQSEQMHNNMRRQRAYQMYGMM